MDSMQTGGIQGKGWQDVLTVTDVTCIIGEMLESRALQDIWVRGELSNYKRHNSGHHYFSLGDQDAHIHCVMWRADARGLHFTPESGMDVLAHGSMGVYPQAGRYQFYVRELKLAGEGEKHILVERWKRELDREGYFDPGKKRQLPPYPARIGIVTSESGAALHDILTVLSRRYPLEVVLSPTAVQGEYAHSSIAEAIRRVDGVCDIIIVARGGGSYEDLFAFHHPDVVRAIRSCKTAVISAVGHAVDVTLSDLAADIRAPTPSAAAELAVPDRTELLQELRNKQERLEIFLNNEIDRHGRDLEDLRLRIHPRRLIRQLNIKRLEFSDISERLARGVRVALSTVESEHERMAAVFEARVRRWKSELAELSVLIQPRHLLRRIEDERRLHADLPDRLRHLLEVRIERERLVLAELRAVLEGKNPQQLLARGYCYMQKGSIPVVSIHQLSKGDRITVYLKDGNSKMRVEEIEK